jgi:KaiC/GvpD/RAD55 family RecA-like ATPase
MEDEILNEMRRLWSLGLSLHWLHPRSKKPIGMGWSEKPRRSLKELETSYYKENNLGCRLGKTALLEGGYQGVIDSDIRSPDPRHLIEMNAALKELFGDSLDNAPTVLSGSGNGSHHTYVRTRFLLQGKKLAKSKETIQIKKEGALKTVPCWEIEFLGNGRQVVLPPSIHPDTGKEYRWKNGGLISPLLPFVEIPGGIKNEKTSPKIETGGYKFEVVDLVGSDLPDSTVDMLLHGGDGVDKVDRSAEMFRITKEMKAFGYSNIQIISVISDPELFFGKARRGNRQSFAQWIDKYCIQTADRQIREEFSVIPEGEKSDLPKRKYTPFWEIKQSGASSYLVEDFIDKETLTVVYGEANSGKTFFALDLVLHIAAGKEWCGRKVEQGGVIYGAIEGGRRINERIIAFRQEYRLEEIKVPFFLTRDPINLLDSDVDVKTLISDIEEHKKIYGPISILVVDTLSRALSGGNENDSVDMGAFVKNADAIRAASGVTVLAVHHSGKNKQLGARGHSLLRCAVDTEIEIKENDIDPRVKVIHVTKQRDYDLGMDGGFTLKEIEIGFRDDGTPVRSCVINPTSIMAVKDFSENKKKDGWTEKALKVLKELLQKSEKIGGENDGILGGKKVETRENWKNAFIIEYCIGKDEKYQSVTFNRAVKELLETSKCFQGGQCFQYVSTLET